MALPEMTIPNATRGKRATRYLACQRDAREAWPDIFSSGLPVECSLLNRRDATPRLSRTFRRRRRTRKAKRYLSSGFFLLPFFLLQEKERMGKRSVLFQIPAEKKEHFCGILRGRMRGITGLKTVSESKTIPTPAEPETSALQRQHNHLCIILHGPRILRRGP